MSDEGTLFKVGDIGKHATVLVGEHLVNVSVQVTNAEEAEALVKRLRAELAQAPLHGPLRALEPLVLANRTEELAEIREFFDAPAAKVLYIHGLAGTGKSTLARGALEFRSPGVNSVWVNCHGLDASQLLAQINTGLELKAESLLRDKDARIPQQIAGVLGAIGEPAILILDQLEFLLDEDGRYESDDMASALRALTEMDHQAKVLITSRMLPAAAIRGSNTSQVLRLSGLSEEHAAKLFDARAGVAVERADTALSEKVLSRLEGNPKFIELLALALDELSTKDVLDALLEATDIGDYLVHEILSRLDEEQRQILHAASVFRSLFSIDALRSVYETLYQTDTRLASNVRTVVRRALLDATSGATKSYTMHGLIRDALPLDPARSATAHAAAAKWALRAEFEATDPGTWAEGLYHLMRAAELCPSDHKEAYLSFMLERREPLYRAGYGYRLVGEWRRLLILKTNPYSELVTRGKLAIEVERLGDKKAAASLFRETVAGWQALRVNVPEELGDEGMTVQEYQQKIDSVLVKVQIDLANALLGDEIHKDEKNKQRVEEAATIATSVEEAVAQHQDHVGQAYLDLRFSLARIEEDGAEMLRWATKNREMAEMRLQQAEHGSEAEWFAKSDLANSSFQLSIASISTKQIDKYLKYSFEYLRTNLELGSLVPVSSGLYNLGAVFSAIQPNRGAAMLLAHEQLEEELGVLPSVRIESCELAIAGLVADGANIADGRIMIAEISDTLVPYYDRAVARRRAG